MVVEKGDLSGLLEEDMQLLEKQRVCFLSCRNKTKQNKIPKNLYGSKTGVHWARKAIFDCTKHLVLWMSSRISEMLHQWAVRDKYWLNVKF